MSYKEVLDQLKARQYFTPDLKELEKYNKHLLFVWDSFKLTYPQEKTLVHCPFIGEASTLENNFVMKVCPTFPIIYQVKEDEKVHQNAVPVLGEVYAVGLHDILRMDALMDNHGSYERKKRYIALHDQKFPSKSEERRVVVEAFIYIATNEFKTEMLRSMMSGSQIRDKGKTYWSWIHQNMKPLN